MRYIDLEQLKLPDGWENKARNASDEIRALAQDKRADAINTKASIWQELKDGLKKLSHHKCWYCESKRHRSDDAVDHFRPKNRVAEHPGHEGYWWLAFDWHNYRFSCTYCNSKRIDKSTGNVGGKQDYFPLLLESSRACSPNDSLDDEQPCLLDPTDGGDPGLLWFIDNGSVVPRYPGSATFRLRAETSIGLYHLNCKETCEQRQILYNHIKKLVARGKRYLNRAATGDTTAKSAFGDVVSNLIRLRKEDAPFSAAANAYLMGLRGIGNEWLETIFSTS